MNAKVILICGLGLLSAFLAHHYLPPTTTQVSTKSEDAREPFSFFTWNSRKEAPGPIDLPSTAVQAPSETEPPQEEHLSQVEEPPREPAHSHLNCEQVVRRAKSIYALYFVGIPYRPAEETVERQLLQEIAYGQFSSQHEAASFIYQLCEMTNGTTMPLWPELPPGSLREDVSIENQLIQ